MDLSEELDFEEYDDNDFSGVNDILYEESESNTDNNCTKEEDFSDKRDSNKSESNLKNNSSDKQTTTKSTKTDTNSMTKQSLIEKSGKTSSEPQIISNKSKSDSVKSVNKHRVEPQFQSFNDIFTNLENVLSEAETPKPNTDTNDRSVTKSVIKSKAKPQTRPEAKPETRPEVRNPILIQTKSKTTVDVRVEATPQIRSKPKDTTVQQKNEKTVASITKSVVKPDLSQNKPKDKTNTKTKVGVKVVNRATPQISSEPKNIAFQQKNDKSATKVTKPEIRPQNTPEIVTQTKSITTPEVRVNVGNEKSSNVMPNKMPDNKLNYKPENEPKNRAEYKLNGKEDESISKPNQKVESKADKPENIPKVKSPESENISVNVLETNDSQKCLNNCENNLLKPIVTTNVSDVLTASTSTSYLKTDQIVSTTSIPFASIRRTIEIDNKFYQAVRKYLTTKEFTVGYDVNAFMEDVQKFRLKDNKLFRFGKEEVIESVDQQIEIPIELHLNSKAKNEKSKHRNRRDTQKAIQNKYFWPTIEADVNFIIDHCLVCNPREYDLMSNNIWKYIEIGIIEEVLIIRDLNEESSIFKCALLETMNPLNLSKHLIEMFKTYGIPYAIRIVLNKEIQNLFTKELSECLSKGLLEFKEQIEFINKIGSEQNNLPTIDIKIEFDSNKCPKNEKEWFSMYSINTNDISLLYIFSSNYWLIKDSIFKTISADIKSFAQKNNEWKSKVNFLTFYFQNFGINKKNVEIEEESKSDTKKKTSNSSKVSKEVQMLLSECDTKSSNKKRVKKEVKKYQPFVNEKSNRESSSEWSDDEVSQTSKRSVTSTKKQTKRSDSSDKKQTNDTNKNKPFKEVLREKERERHSSDSVIVIDDDSQQSFLSQISSSNSVHILPSESDAPIIPPTDNNKVNELKTDLNKYDLKGYCLPCIVLIDNFSSEDIERAIEGEYDFGSVSQNEINFNSEVNSPEVVFSDKSDKNQRSDSEVSEDIPLTGFKENLQKNSETDSIKKIISEELKKRSKVERKTSCELNLSEDSSGDETIKNVNPIPQSVPSKKSPIPAVNQTSSKLKTPNTSQNRLKRKKSAKSSDSDSDYDYNKDKSSAITTKRTKTNTSSKTSVNTNSKIKNVKRISKRVIASDSSDAELSEDNSPKTKIIKEIPKTKIIKEMPKNETKVFNCDYCDFNTNERNLYILHQGKHKNDPKNKILCTECSQVFYTKESLNRHKEEEHPPNISEGILYGCEECKQFSSSNIEELDQHLMSQHIEDLTFLKTSSASKHRCRICKNFAAQNKEIMANHLTNKHRMYRCVFDCPYTASDFQSLERHAKSIHSRYGYPFECKYCGFGSAVFGILVQHRHEKHAIDWIEQNGRNKCCLCETYFDYDNTYAILDHFSSHSIDFTYFECKSCGKRCKQMEQLKKHCETHHAVGPAEGLEAHISNLSKLFDDLCQQLTERNNKLKKSYSNSNETQNAIAGLMDDAFIVEEEESMPTTDLVATALNFAFNEDNERMEAPTISIPDPNGNDMQNEFVDIQEDEEGNWHPVSF